MCVCVRVCVCVSFPFIIFQFVNKHMHCTIEKLDRQINRKNSKGFHNTVQELLINFLCSIHRLTIRSVVFTETGIIQQLPSCSRNTLGV